MAQLTIQWQDPATFENGDPFTSEDLEGYNVSHTVNGGAPVVRPFSKSRALLVTNLNEGDVVEASISTQSNGINSAPAIVTETIPTDTRVPNPPQNITTTVE